MNKATSHKDLISIMGTGDNSKELLKVVRSLMRFIVIESKDYIEESHKEEYINSYLYAFTKATNGLSSYVDMNKLKDQILKDIQQNFKDLK